MHTLQYIIIKIRGDTFILVNSISKPPNTEEILVLWHLLIQPSITLHNNSILNMAGDWTSNPHSNIDTAGILLPQMHYLQIIQTTLEGTQSFFFQSICSISPEKCVKTAKLETERRRAFGTVIAGQRHSQFYNTSGSLEAI